MVVCKYFLQGNCRFGANCRNEHPANQGGNQGGFGNQNRFGALSNTGNDRFGNNNDTCSTPQRMFFHRGHRFARPVSQSEEHDSPHEDERKPKRLAISSWGDSYPESRSVSRSVLTKSSKLDSKQYTLNIQDVKLDLTRGSGRPKWVLSTYGAGRGTPASLFDGNEFSPEEIRTRFYEMAGKGQEAQADQEAIQLWTKAEQDMDNVLNHIDDISKFMEEAEMKHPNRYDFLKSDGTQTRDELAKAAEASNTNNAGFGASSAFGQSSNTSNPFAKPAAATFGQPTGPSAFGGSNIGKSPQPSAFGQPAFGQSGFGAPSSGFGQAGTGFGQSTNTTTFGQPASTGAFGKPAFGQSGFGQPAFGQPAQSSSAFGQSAQPSGQSAFGQTTSTPAFGQSTFGQTSKPSAFGAASANSAFGSPSSGFGQQSQSQPTSAFGQSLQPTPAFGQPSQPNAGFGQSAFGKPAQPGGFGQAAFGQSLFGQSAQTAGSSPFGSQTANTSSGFGFDNNTTSTFGQPSQSNESPFSKAAEATTTTEVSMDADSTANMSTQASDSSNPFGSRQTFMTPAQTATDEPSVTSAPVQPVANTSQTPHVLISRPPRALHYTQTLPTVPSQTSMSNRLTSYRGQRVEYLDGNPGEIPCYNRPDRKGPEKIWFPEAGATQEVVALNKEDKIMDLQEESSAYTDAVKAQYAYLFEKGQWKDGKLPSVPPLREWCIYDF